MVIEKQPTSIIILAVIWKLYSKKRSHSTSSKEWTFWPYDSRFRDRTNLQTYRIPFSSNCRMLSISHELMAVSLIPNLGSKLMTAAPLRLCFLQMRFADYGITLNEYTAYCAFRCSVRV